MGTELCAALEPLSVAATHPSPKKHQPSLSPVPYTREPEVQRETQDEERRKLLSSQLAPSSLSGKGVPLWRFRSLKKDLNWGWERAEEGLGEGRRRLAPGTGNSRGVFRETSERPFQSSVATRHTSCLPTLPAQALATHQGACQNC